MSDITEKYGNMKIRDLIKQFPAVVGVLEEHQIDCVHCKHGRCRLYDLAEGENLTMEEEVELMDKISGVISGGE